MQSDATLTRASSNANSLSIGNDFTQTTTNSAATATHGNIAAAQSSAGATTNNLNNQLTGNALADATNANLVQTREYKDQNVTYVDGSTGPDGSSSNTILANIYENNSTAITTLDNQQINNNQASYQSNLVTNAQNSRQKITDTRSNSAAIQTISQNSDTATTLDESDHREIIITIDAGSEQIIVEKIMGSDNRVLILSAAKYLSGFPLDVKEYFLKLYNAQCNCQQIREYAMNLLAEGN
jgi:hypothetical protein